MQPENQSLQIEIEVINPQQRSEFKGANKYYVYTVKGKDKLGQIDISKRYSDFDTVRTVMVSRWPGCYIPSLPQKKFIGNNEGMFIEFRKKGLNDFLNLIAKNQYLWYSEENQLFLKNKSSDDKSIIALGKVGLQELSNRYHEKFREFEQQELKGDVGDKIVKFSWFLKEVVPKLENLAEMVQKIIIAKKKFNDKSIKMIQFCMPDYEDSCLNEYVLNKKDHSKVFKSNEKYSCHQLIDIKKNLGQQVIDSILEQIKRQKRELACMEQTLKGKDHYEGAKQKAIQKVKTLQVDLSSVNLGKESIMAKIKKKSKDEQLQAAEKQLQSSKAELQIYSLISKVVESLLVMREIDKFKKCRQQAYYTLIKKYATIELQLANAEKLFWMNISQHPKINLNIKEQKQNQGFSEGEQGNQGFSEDKQGTSENKQGFSEGNQEGNQEFSEGNQGFSEGNQGFSEGNQGFSENIQENSGDNHGQAEYI